MAAAEHVVYNGIKYYQSKNEKYLKSARGKFLHRQVWEDAFGAIPPNCQIHHKDGNTRNNNPENLECVARHDHLSEHGIVHGRTEKRLAQLDTIRPLAAEWHGSPEGKKWHSKHSKEILQNRKPVRKTCAYCGKKFEDVQARRVTRFCSSKCRAYDRKKRGVDNEQRICAKCGKTFTINRYEPTRCCSRSCSSRLGHQS